MKVEQVVIIEEDAYMKHYPFSVMHPVWEMRVGAKKIHEKYRALFPDAEIIFYSKRNEILKSFLARTNYQNPEFAKKNTLIALAGFLPDAETVNAAFDFEAKMPLEGGRDTSFAIRTKTAEGEEKTAAVFMKAESVIHSGDAEVPFLKEIIENFGSRFAGITSDKKDIYIDSIYDAVYFNASAIENDLRLPDFNLPKIDEKKYSNIACKNAENIFVHPDAEIEPFCFLNAEKGAIIIDENAKIAAGSLLEGPCFIGKNSIIRSGAKIYSNTSIGETCKIGGEVEDTIIQGFTNKQHEGFLGHSFLGEWVNLGAGTDNSDLKNTYGAISTLVEGFRYPTGRQFLGVFIGDHTKTGIGTKFPTGSVAGICSSIVCGGYAEKSVPSFSFGGEEKSPVYDISKAIMTARRVLARRSRTLTPEEEELMKIEFDHAKQLRELKRTVTF